MDVEELRSVVPIAQSRHYGPVWLTLLSLEDYHDAFLLRAVLSTRPTGREMPGYPASVLGSEVPFTGQDDRGNRYSGKVWRLGGIDKTLEWIVRFTPPLDPVAVMLDLVLPEPAYIWSFSVRLDHRVPHRVHS